MIPVSALEQIGGVQAQEPASPFLALWTRLADFDPGALRAAFERRDVVKATLMRITLHAVSAADYRALLPALLPMFRASGSLRRGTPRPEHVEELAAAAAEFAVTPRRSFELRDFLAGHAGTGSLETPVWWWVRRTLPLVHVPEEVGWSFTRRPLITTASTWFDDPSMVDGGGMAIEVARRHVVRRYLGGFGPASTADLSAWTGLSASDFREAIAALDDEGSLVRFRDEAGRELLDLPDAPRPGEDATAPPRLLPMWDEILLGFRDRTRVISDEDRRTRHQPQRRRAPDVPRRRSGRRVLVGRAGRCRDTSRLRAVPSTGSGRPARARGGGRPAGPLRRAAGARRLWPVPDVGRAPALTRPAGHG